MHKRLLTCLLTLFVVLAILAPIRVIAREPVSVMTQSQENTPQLKKTDEDNRVGLYRYFGRPSWAELIVAICAMIALWQLWLLRETNYITKENAKRQLRAYLIIDDMEIIGYAGNGPMRLVIQMINSGQTPAYEMNIKESYIWIGDDKIPIPTLYNKSGQGTLAAQQKHVFISGVNPSDKSKIQDRKNQLHITGNIYYKDIYNTEHKTSFNYLLIDRDIVNPNGLSVFLYPADEGNESN
jgi:hypothetical protein